MKRVTLSAIEDRLSGILVEVFGVAPESFTDITADSKLVSKGSIFVALEGTKVDGHSFINQARENGASLTIVSRSESNFYGPFLRVTDTRVALSKLAGLFWGDPSHKLSVIGITGTNGKTTTNWILFSLLNLLGYRSSRVGTLGFATWNGITKAGNLTTPDAISIQSLLQESLDGGATHSVMEVSSHALSQHRADDVRFEVGVFTNLSRDHLDYHVDMQDYLDAKMRLFELVGRFGGQNAVVCLEDPVGKDVAKIAEISGCKVVTFGSSDDCILQYSDVCHRQSGATFSLTDTRSGRCVEIGSPLFGDYNVQNLVGAIAALVSTGEELEAIAKLCPKIPQVPGRIENVGSSEIAVYVDYAHTPDALENVLKSIKPLTEGNLWVIFGCGGDRDKGKRPQMAVIASKMADRVVVTSDNPRTEDPHSIISDVLSSGTKPHIVEVDRKKAILETLAQAKKGDVVLVAGKGHEDYQIIGNTKYHFSDQEIIKEFFIDGH